MLFFQNSALCPPQEQNGRLPAVDFIMHFQQEQKPQFLRGFVR
jgi:hypothetical protein